MLSIHCKIALFFFISLFGLSAILKIRNGEHAHYTGLVVAYTWNREKQMFVARGKSLIWIIFDKRKFRGWNGLFPKLHPHQLILKAQFLDNKNFSLSAAFKTIFIHLLCFLILFWLTRFHFCPFMYMYLSIYMFHLKKSINSRKAPWG